MDLIYLQLEGILKSDVEVQDLILGLPFADLNYPCHKCARDPRGK